MAGSEQVGPRRRRPRAVRRGHLGAHPDARTPTPAATPGSRRWSASLGADVRGAVPRATTTRLVAVVSHVPHLTAATLMNLADRRAERARRAAAPGRRRVPGHDPGGGRPSRDLARHLRRQRRPPSSPASTPWWRRSAPCATSGGGRPRRAAARPRTRPPRPAAPCRPGPCGPSGWPSCGCRCPTGRACWPRSPPGRGPRRQHLGHRDRPLHRGPAGVLVLVVDAEAAERSATPADAGATGPRPEPPGMSPPPAAPERPRGRPAAGPLRGHGRGSPGRQVDLAPGPAAGRARRGHLGRPGPVRRRRRGPHRGPPWRALGAPSADAGAGGGRRRPGAAEPAGAARLRQLGHHHAPAGRRGGRPPAGGRADGDESLSARPMDRVAGRCAPWGPRRRPGRAVPAAARGRGGRAARQSSTRHPVASAQVKSCVLLAGLGAEGDDRGPRAGGHPAPTPRSCSARAGRTSK